MLAERDLTPEVWESMTKEQQAVVRFKNSELWSLIRAAMPGASGSLNQGLVYHACQQIAWDREAAQKYRKIQEIMK